MNTVFRTQSPDTSDPTIFRNCPAWCGGGHLEALEDGVSVEDARRHTSFDMGEILPSLVGPFHDQLMRKGGGNWRVQIEADEHPNGWYNRPYVILRASSGDAEQSLDLTPGEARDLAGALNRFADAAQFKTSIEDPYRSTD